MEATLSCGDTIAVQSRPAIGAYRLCIHCGSRKRVTEVIDPAAIAADLEAAATVLAHSPGIPGDILDELMTEADFADAAAEAAEITSRMAELRSSELAEAREAAELADRSWQAAEHAVKLAADRLAARMAAAGVVRTAEGFKLAAPVTGPASAEIDAAAEPVKYAPVCDCGHTANLHPGPVATCTACQNTDRECSGWNPTEEAGERALALGRALGLNRGQLGHLTGAAGLEQ